MKLRSKKNTDDNKYTAGNLSTSKFSIVRSFHTVSIFHSFSIILKALKEEKKQQNCRNILLTSVQQLLLVMLMTFPS